MKNNINSLDILKFVLAIFVIAIHTDPLPENKFPIYELIVNSAVPCFLMISSYLVFFKNKNDNDYLKKYISKILKLYIIWTILYLPITIFFFIKSEKSFLISIIKFIRNFVFIGEQAFSYQLWYLLSIVYSLTIILLLKKIKLKDIYIFLISIALYLIGMLIDYSIDNINLFNGTILFVITGVKHLLGSGRMFYSLLYICIGMYFSNSKFNLKPRFLFIMILFNFLINNYIDFFVFKIILYVSVFTFFLSLDLKKHNIYKFLRKSSTIMYFTHMIFYFIATLFLDGYKYCNILYFSISIICTLLLSCVVFYIEKKGYKNRLLQLIF